MLKCYFHYLIIKSILQMFLYKSYSYCRIFPLAYLQYVYTENLSIFLFQIRWELLEIFTDSLYLIEQCFNYQFRWWLVGCFLLVVVVFLLLSLFVFCSVSVPHFFPFESARRFYQFLWSTRKPWRKSIV